MALECTGAPINKYPGEKQNLYEFTWFYDGDVQKHLKLHFRFALPDVSLLM